MTSHILTGGIRFCFGQTCGRDRGLRVKAALDPMSVEPGWTTKNGLNGNSGLIVCRAIEQHNPVQVADGKNRGDLSPHLLVHRHKPRGRQSDFV
jgi:hypothetical protein